MRILDFKSLPVKYEDLTVLEKTVLEHKIAASTITAPEYLSSVEPGYSNSTYYRHYNQAEEKLVSLGLLKSDGEPTFAAYELLPPKSAERLLSEMHREIQRQHDELNDRDDRLTQLEAQRDDLERDLRLKARQVESLLMDVERFESLSSLLGNLGALQLDENWVTVVAALNSVELALKRKLEEMGVQLPKGMSFKELYSLVESKIKEKEGRALPTTFIKPEDLYGLRSKIDHWGHKYPKFSKDETDFIARQTVDLIKGIFRG